MSFSSRDIRCGKCGEPWGVYHINQNMSDEEGEKLRRGVGCPCCDWGDDDDAIGSKDEQEKRRVEQIKDMVFGVDDRDPAKYM